MTITCSEDTLKDVIEAFLQISVHNSIGMCVWDGDLISKTGRDILVDAKLVETNKEQNKLTPSGVELAETYKIECAIGA